MRWLAIGSGALILFAVSHVAISATGGYGTPHSFLTLAVAFGVGLGAVFSGAAWAARRYTLSIALVGALIAGEAFGFMATAERLIASREAQQAPLRLATETFNAARQRVADAAKALDDHPTTSQRLEAAIAAKNLADAAAVQKSAERGCVENCRKLLQAQVDAASAEIAAARGEIDRAKQSLEADLQTARSALAAIKAPESRVPVGRPPRCAGLGDRPSALGVGLDRCEWACVSSADIWRSPSCPGACRDRQRNGRARSRERKLRDKS